MKTTEYPVFIAGEQYPKRDQRRTGRAMVVFYDTKNDELFTIGFLFKVPVKRDRIVLDPNWIILGEL